MLRGHFFRAHTWSLNTNFTVLEAPFLMYFEWVDQRILLYYTILIQYSSALFGHIWSYTAVLWVMWLLQHCQHVLSKQDLGEPSNLPLLQLRGGQLVPFINRMVWTRPQMRFLVDCHSKEYLKNNTLVCMGTSSKESCIIIHEIMRPSGGSRGVSKVSIETSFLV